MRLSAFCAAIFLLASALYSHPLRAQTAIAVPAPARFVNTLPSATNPFPKPQATLAPFSRVALAGGISAMGVNLQAAVNVSRHLNLRGVGNIFNYSLNNLSVSGFNVSGKLNFASAGASIDYFPWSNHGFRISPGALFYNQNAVSATMTATGGTSFTLNNATYYSSPSDPVTGVGSLNLNAYSPAPSLTVGWGNLIPRRGGHFSFPFEIGAAYDGAPEPAIAFTSGQVCSDPQGTQNCENVVGDPTLNANLQAQLTKYKKDLQPLRFYPIVSFGMGYNFSIRRSGLAAR